MIPLIQLVEEVKGCLRFFGPQTLDELVANLKKREENKRLGRPSIRIALKDKDIKTTRLSNGQICYQIK